MSLITTSELTMSSREIASVVSSRHADVCRTIQRLMEKSVINGYQPTAYTHEQNRQEYYEYFIGKRDSYVVVAQLSPEFTAKIVDRWQELEERQRPKIPTNFAEALQLAADQAKQLELQAPKVAFVDNLVERANLLTATQIGQKHKLSAIKLNKVLTELKVYSRGVKRCKVFQQWFIDKGYGEMKKTEQGYDQPLFTNAGEIWINEMLYSEGIV